MFVEKSSDFLLLFFVLQPCLTADQSGSTILVAGAQPYGFGYALVLSGTDLSAGSTVTISSDKALFQVPSGKWAVVVSRVNTGGADCWANFTAQ